MPRPANRQELITEIESEYATLKDLIGGVQPSELAASCVNSAGWSLKDALAHVADWAERCQGWCNAGLKGESPVVPAQGFSWKETPQLNAKIYQARRHHAAKRVLDDLDRGHRALLELARTMSERDLFTPRRFAWTGPTWCMALHIRANTAAHYRWASKHFRKWIRTGGSADMKADKRGVKRCSRVDHGKRGM